MESLKMKYESIKKELKKKVNKNNAEALKTGGEKPEFIKIDGPEKELLDALGLSAHYIPSNLDSDSILPQSCKGLLCQSNKLLYFINCLQPQLKVMIFMFS